MKRQMNLPWHTIVAITLLLIVAILLPYGTATCIRAIIDAAPEPIVAAETSNEFIGPLNGSSPGAEASAEPQYTYNRNDYGTVFYPELSYGVNASAYNEQIYSEGNLKFRSGRVKDKYTYSSTLLNERSIAELSYYDGKITNAMMCANVVDFTYNADNIEIKHTGGNSYKFVYDEDGNLISKYVNDTLTERYFYENGKLSKTLNPSDNFAFEILLDENNQPVSKKQFLYLNDRFFSMLTETYGEIPAEVNSGITYERNYTYLNQAYITEKRVGEKIYNYDYINDVIVKETVTSGDSTYTVAYIFDANMNRLGFAYANKLYFYLYDVLGNVLEILDENGESVLAYSYDILGKASVSGENTALAEINSFAFRAKDNWYFDYATQQYYVGPNTIFNSQYAKTVGNSTLSSDFYFNPNRKTVFKGEAHNVCPVLQLSLSPETELESLVLDRAAEALDRNNVTPIKSVLSFSDETDELTGRTDIYVKQKGAEGEYGAFNAQAYKAVNENSDVKQEISDAFLQEVNNGKIFVFDGEGFFIPEQASLAVKGHFIENGKYVKYYSDLDNPGLIHYTIGEKENYDESLGNLYDYDNEKFILFFGSTLNNNDMIRVGNITDTIDYETIRAEIEAEINARPEDAYSVNEIQIYYISEEYINSLIMGQRENLYLGGRTAQQMYDEFGDDWSFTMYDGQLIHTSQVPPELEEEEGFNWGKFLKKIAIGVGCILVAAVVTTVTAGAGLACFAATAATLTGISTLGGVVGGTIKGIQTNSWEGFGEGFAEGFEVTAITSSVVQTVGAFGGSPLVSFCFPESTPVMTALGSTKPIEAIAAGDMVLSYNEFTKAYGANPVVNTFVNKTDVLAQVQVNGELIESTTTHPYFTKNAGWKYAGDLKRGDILLLADGSESIIEESATLRFLDNEISVYNFEVANDHTYFVGNTGVLVHNSGCAAGSLLSNSAGLTGEQLAALLGIGTVAAGGAVAGTIIVDGIDSGTITLPGANVIEEKGETWTPAIAQQISQAVAAEKDKPDDEQRIYYPVLRVVENAPNRIRMNPVTRREAMQGVLAHKSYITYYEHDAKYIIEKTAPLRGIPGLYAGIHENEKNKPLFVEHYHYFINDYKFNETPSAHSFFILKEFFNNGQ